MATFAYLQLLLTIMFVLIGGYCLLRCAYFAHAGVRHPVSAWVTELAHLAMSAAMLGMIWAATGWDRWGIQLTIFAVLAGWFAVRAVVGPPPGQSRAVAATRPVLLYESVSFSAMCWMLLGMFTPAGMLTMTDHRMATPATTLPPAAASAVTAGLATVLAVAAGAWAWGFRQAVVSADVGEQHSTANPLPHGRALFGAPRETACQMAMAAGMALALARLL